MRALRVGVVLSETLVAEHLLHAGTAFTIGQSIRNLVPLPVAGLPRRWQLVELCERGVLLRLGPGMGARVAVDGHVLGRADLDARGAHTRAATLVTLPPGTHGKIDLGEVRILFQEVQVPAPPPRPQLPRAVKGTLADRIDRRMAVFAAASLLVHLGIMTAAQLNDPAEDKSIAERALAQYTPETISIIDADDPILDLDKQPDKQDPSAAPTQTPAKPSTPEPSRSTPTPARPRPAQPVTNDSRDLAGDATRMADLLFANEGGGPIDAGDMAKRRPGNDLDKQLQEMNDKNAKATIGNETGDRLRDRGPRQGTVEEPVIGDPNIKKADDRDKTDTLPPSRIDVIKQPPKKPGIDTDAIVGKIRTTYMGAMQRCYKKALAEDPTLSGKVTMLFTLSEKGGVSDPEAKGVSPVFEECIEGVMPRWSFTPVTDQDGDAVEIDIGVTLQLSI